MAYEPYATPNYYKNTYAGSKIPEESLTKALIQASRHIDSLTYNRIVGRGFSGLTPFQQETIQEVVCRQADFEWENADVLETVLQSYGINGVSMQFGVGWNVFVNNGVAMQMGTYSLLEQTGLTCRLAVGR